MKIIEIQGVPRSGTTILFNIFKHINDLYDLNYNIKHPAHTYTKYKNENEVLRVGIIRNLYHVLNSNAKIHIDNQEDPDDIHNKYLQTYFSTFLQHIEDYDYIIVYEPYFPSDIFSLVRYICTNIFNIECELKTNLDIARLLDVNNIVKIYRSKTFIREVIDKKTLFKPGHVSTNGLGSFQYLNCKALHDINSNALFQEYNRLHFALLSGSKKDFIYTDVKRNALCGWWEIL